MIVHILFVQYRESYSGQFAPNAILAWDEHSVEENEEGFHDAVAEIVKSLGDEIVSHRVIPIQVNGDQIRSILMPDEAASLKGEILES